MVIKGFEMWQGQERMRWLTSNIVHPSGPFEGKDVVQQDNETISRVDEKDVPIFGDVVRMKEAC